MDSQAPQHHRRDVSISLLKANVYALYLLLPIILAVLAPFLLLWGIKALAFGVRDMIHALPLWLGLFLAGVVLHEAVHALAWMLFARQSWNQMRFGFDVKTLTPFAHSTEPMSVGAYRCGALAPGILIGVLPALAGILLGNVAAMLFGLLFTTAATGDLIVVWTLRGVPDGTLVEDHPSRAGCIVLEPVRERNDEETHGETSAGVARMEGH